MIRFNFRSKIFLFVFLVSCILHLASCIASCILHAFKSVKKSVLDRVSVTLKGPKNWFLFFLEILFEGDLFLGLFCFS
jgi:hypothetical protein